MNDKSTTVKVKVTDCSDDVLEVSKYQCLGEYKCLEDLVNLCSNLVQ